MAKISLVETLPERIAEEWQTLVHRAAEPNPFSEPWLAAASLRHLRQGRAVWLLEVRRSGQLIGLALLQTARRYGRARVAHVQNWCSPNHFLGTPLIARGLEREFWRAAMKALDAAPWARGFLHLTGLVEGGPTHVGLEAAAKETGRHCAVVHRELRPLLHTSLSTEDYYRRNVRTKRRSEHRRLRTRLAELGRLELRRLEDPAEAPRWADDFLRLEASGWKREAGSALACRADTAAFFRETIEGAAGGGRLQFLRLDLDGEPIAMTTCLLAPPGAFGFKSAFDERFARFSPGILLQIAQMEVVDRPDILWTDSCARPGHATASLWSEQRPIVRLTVRLAGLARTLAYGGVRLLDEAARLRRTGTP